MSDFIQFEDVWRNHGSVRAVDRVSPGIGKGEFPLSRGYSHDIIHAESGRADVPFRAPEAGHAIACDLLVILKDSMQAALAHKFINFLHDPAVAVENSVFINPLCPNPAGLLSPEARTGEGTRDLGAENAKWTRIWDQIKAAP